MIRTRWDVAVRSKEDFPQIIELVEQLFYHDYSYELYMGIAEHLPSEFELNPIEYRLVFKKRLHPHIHFYLTCGMPVPKDLLTNSVEVINEDR